MNLAIIANGNNTAGDNNAIFADRFPFPRRPFLRRQESQLINAATPLIFAAMPPIDKRFLPTQEWSGEERRCFAISPIRPIVAVKILFIRFNKKI